MAEEESRVALLIGVAANPGAEHRFPPLGSTVDADLRDMSAALRDSGYAVQTLLNPTRNQITERITGLSQSVPAGSTLLLYFTGHGVRIGDTDYLVPADAQVPASDDLTGWVQPHVQESLLNADISRYLVDCGSGTVLWLIDACRAAEDGRAVVFGSSVTKGQPNGGFAMMTGCGPGERSGFAETGSHFTRALARAFAPLTEAATVEEVYQTVRRETRALALRARSEPQAVLIRYGSDLEEETKARKVAEGRRLLDAWQDAVRTSALWGRVSDCDTKIAIHMQDCLVSLTADAARHVHRAQERLPDPWADDEFPVRLLCNQLPRLMPEDVQLSALEVTALIAGVLLHEAAWAERLSQAAELRPKYVRRDPDPNNQRRHYEQIAEHYPQIAEKLAGWRSKKNGSSEDWDAVTLWLVHRWIAERFATDEEAVPALLADGFVARLLDVAPSAPDETLTGRAELLSGALRTVAGGLALGAPPDDQQLSFPDRHVVGNTFQSLRVRPLAGLLRLAGLLAFDTRCLPEVLAEHLAVSDPVVPREVIIALRGARWDIAQDGGAPLYLHLDALCPHPAIHAALATVVEDADELGHVLREAAHRLSEDEGKLLRGLPARLTDQRLRPARERGADAYDVPLARFSLAQTEIRQLLMGEKLYDGRPELALRELYQNAMDACRYRAMRVRYLRACGREPGDWAGRIRIEVGEDSRGRYVECIDNGVGMTMDQLKDTFTRAGRRFDQSRSFRREQAAWLRHDRSLRLYPNSRFGIGVFSYFMLADEMTIVTRPVNLDGRPAESALRVEVPASGSLFRVREEDKWNHSVLADGGTRLRLYLRNPWTLTRNSCVSVFRSLVHLAEFRLEVRGENGNYQVWLPGCLQPGEGSHEIAVDSAVQAVPGTLWWVEGDGMILCDGIVTDKRTFGYVLNLSGAHAGELSINRNTLERYDVRWADEQILQGAEALEKWPALTLDWLQATEARQPSVARILWRAWKGRGVRVSAGYGRTMNLDEAGWFKLDASLDGNSTPFEHKQELCNAVRPWRSAVLGLGHHARREAAPLSLDGFPVPQPGWSDIATKVEGDWRRAVMVAYEQEMTVAEVLRATRGLRIAHPRLAGPALRAGGDLGWKPDFTDRYIMTGLLGERRNPLHEFPFTARGRRPSPRNSPIEIYYQHLPGDLAGIVRTSAKHGLALGELAASCTRYAPFVGEQLPTVPDHHRDYICTDDDLRLLYLQEDAYGWRPATNPWDVRVVARTAGCSPGDAQRRMAGFGWLGRPTPDPALVDKWASVPEDLFPFLRRYVMDSSGRTVLPWAATIDLAAEAEITLREAERILSRQAEAIGMLHHRRYTKGPAGRNLVPSPETGSLVGLLHDVGVRLEDGVSLRDLAFVRPQEMPWEEHSWYVDELREAGVVLPNAARLLSAWDGLPMPSKYAFSGTDPSFVGADYPVPATSAVLFTGSQLLQEELSFLWKTAHRVAQNLELCADLVPPQLPEELKGFRPTWDETVALVDASSGGEYDFEWFEAPRWTALTALRLVNYARARRIGARAAFQALTPLRAIGALVPELSDEAMSGLPDDVPTVYDAAAVDPEHRVSAAGSPMVPLDLVSIAGRLGESMRHTWQRRILPYLALEGTPPSIVDVPDVVPCWQDLAILSEGFDGRLPALSGLVRWERLDLSAQVVGESPEWVRERLRSYANMFGLRLTRRRAKGGR